MVSVKFGTTEATSVRVLDSGHIVAVAPAHAKGVVDVTVTTSAGTVTSAGAFEFVDPPPPPKPVTGATAGTPGAWVPPDGDDVPDDLESANALDLDLGASAWAEGNYVLVGTDHIYWNGSEFADGEAPASG